MPSITVQFQTVGSQLLRVEHHLCHVCALRLSCSVRLAVSKAVTNDFIDIEFIVGPCSLFQREGATQAQTIIGEAEFEVQGFRPVFRRWIPEVPEGICHKDILRGLMILAQQKEE